MCRKMHWSRSRSRSLETSTDDKAVILCPTNSKNAQLTQMPIGITLNEFDPEFPSNGMGRAGERLQRYGFVTRVEQPIQSCAAGFHAPRHLHFGDVVFPHRLLDLPGDCFP